MRCLLLPCHAVTPAQLRVGLRACLPRSAFCLPFTHHTPPHTTHTALHRTYTHTPHLRAHHTAPTRTHNTARVRTLHCRLSRTAHLVVVEYAVTRTTHPAARQRHLPAHLPTYAPTRPFDWRYPHLPLPRQNWTHLPTYRLHLPACTLPPPLAPPFPTTPRILQWVSCCIRTGSGCGWTAFLRRLQRKLVTATN